MKAQRLKLVHDLRTPLTIIHGYADQLLAGEVFDKRRAYRMILDAVAEMNAVIRKAEAEG